MYWLIKRPKVSASKESWDFRIFAMFLVVSFLLGGSARADVISLLVLRPLAALVLAYGLVRLRAAHVVANRFLFAFSLAVVALPFFQLLPLPPVLWMAAPGRDIIAAIDRTAGLTQLWRPLSMTPFETRNALFSLLVPLALLVLGVQLRPADRQKLVYLVLALGWGSAILGIMQMIQAADSQLYFYDITNAGSPVGLFANRNHQALLLAMLFPMLAVAAAGTHRSSPFHWLVTAVAGLLLLPMILITGSRSGAMLAVIAILSILPVLGTGWRGKSARLAGYQRRYLRFGLTALGMGLVALTVLLGRAAAWERLFHAGPEEDLRLQILPTLVAMVRRYLPVGTGLGGFERVYQIHEPDSLLMSIYMNHAHNDWLETLLTGGLPAASLLLVAICAFVIRAWRLFRPSAIGSPGRALQRLGLVSVLLIALASFTDYPARTPAIAALFVVAVLWAACPSKSEAAIGAARDAVAV